MPTAVNSNVNDAAQHWESPPRAQRWLRIGLRSQIKSVAAGNGPPICTTGPHEVNGRTGDGFDGPNYSHHGAHHNATAPEVFLSSSCTDSDRKKGELPVALTGIADASRAHARCLGRKFCVLLRFSTIVCASLPVGIRYRLMTGTDIPALPSKMSGVLLVGHGGLDRLVYRSDFPVPVAGAGEVLVRVRAAAVNNTDINMRTGWY